MAKGEIVDNVVSYVVKEIVDQPDRVEVTIIEEAPRRCWPRSALPKRTWDASSAGADG